MCGEEARLGEDWPQAGRERLILHSPVGRIGGETPDNERELLARLGPDAVMMMGDNPALPRMPAEPTLLDFFKNRFGDITVTHLMTSAKRALDEGQDEKVVLACLLHDISNGCFVRPDHGYWSSQMVAPYVDEEIAWAVKTHQALRFFPDESVGYGYPDLYKSLFGPDYQPEPYIVEEYKRARAHKWYMTSRLICMNDIYAFDPNAKVELDAFVDIIGRNFKQPKEGLGLDNSPSAHMWRTILWPTRFL